MNGDSCDNGWYIERMKHPYYGENLSKDAILGNWEAMSQTYDGAGYDIIRGRMIEDLSDMGVLGEGDSLLDIGCGPGMFAIPFSKRVGKVYGMDASAGMLKRLADKAAESDIRNIETLQADWESYVPDCKYDIAFASLCPPANSPESLIKMESCTRRHCVYASSINESDSIHIRIWRRLGKEYSFMGYNTYYPCRFLTDIGRTVEIRTYEQKSDKHLPYEKAFEAEIKRIEQYRGRSPEAEEAVRYVLDPLEEDGNIYYGDTMRIGMLVWKPA